MPDTTPASAAAGAAAVLLALALPLVYLATAKVAVAAVERKIMASVTDAEKVNWTTLLMATPALLVVGFLVVLWAGRGLKAMGFLAKYKVKLGATPAPAPAPAVGRGVSARHRCCCPTEPSLRPWPW